MHKMSQIVKKNGKIDTFERISSQININHDHLHEI